MATKQRLVTFSLDVVRAYHETGHGMAAIDANVPLKSISDRIDPALDATAEGVPGGGALMQLTTIETLPDPVPDHLLAKMLREVHVLVAGTACEALLKGGHSKRYRGRSIPEDFVNTAIGMFDDLEGVSARARLLGASRAERGLLVRAAYVRTMKWLSLQATWRVVEQVAAKVMAEHVVDGDTVAAMMGAGDVPSLYVNGKPQNYGLDAYRVPKSR